VWTSCQRPQKTLLRRGGKNLRFDWQTQQQLFEDFEVELGVDVIEKEDGGLIETSPEKVELRELEKKDDHLHLAAGKDLGGGPAGDDEVELVALRSRQRDARAELVGALREIGRASCRERV